MEPFIRRTGRVGCRPLFYVENGVEAHARIMLPYYPLVMIPILTLPGQAVWRAAPAGECWPCWFP